MTTTLTPTDDDTPIDWKARFGKAVTDGIEGKAAVSAKLRERDQELNTAHLLIKALEQQVERMRPAQEKRIAAEKALAEQADSFGKQLNNQNGIIKDLRKQLGRGQRAALETVVAFLQAEARKLPASDDASKE